jgi:RNA polymerase sigma-70 factor (ECF subfamily)
MNESEAVPTAVPVSSAGSDPRAARETVWKDYVRRCALEESAALAKLYDESSAVVFAVAVRMVGNEADAEEVTLDTYTQLWRNASGYNPERGSVSAWLVTIARSRAIDKLRSRTAHTRFDEPLDGVAEPRSTGANPEEISILNQRRRQVLAALDQIPSDQRRTIHLAYFSGLPHSELAEQLGEPLGTVKTRIRLGMMKMRELLGA